MIYKACKRAYKGTGWPEGQTWWMGDLLFSLSLKPSIILPGKVCPFSQMSTSFLIFSYAREKNPSKFLYTRRER